MILFELTNSFTDVKTFCISQNDTHHHTNMPTAVWTATQVVDLCSMLALLFPQCYFKLAIQPSSTEYASMQVYTQDYLLAYLTELEVRLEWTCCEENGPHVHLIWLDCVAFLGTVEEWQLSKWKNGHQQMWQKKGGSDFFIYSVNTFPFHTCTVTL